MPLIMPTDMDESNRTMLNMSSGFALGLYYVQEPIS